MKDSQRIFGLDLWRAKAILFVLCSHILWLYPQNNTTASQVLKLFGFWGVEMFFVLSGFLIGKILFELFVKENFTFQTLFMFLKRRWFRTLPNYFLVLILNILVGLYFQFNLKEVWKYFFFIQNFNSPSPNFFSESWSLSVEEFTYFLTPLLLFLSQFLFKIKDRSKLFLINISILILFFVLSKLIYNSSVEHNTMNIWNDNLKSMVIYRVDSILIGVLASWFYLNHPMFWNKFKYKMLFLGLVILLFLFIGIGKFKIFIESYPFFWNVIYLPLTSIAFAFLLPYYQQLSTISIWLKKPVILVSKISYSIYLVHYSLILFLMKNWVDTVELSTIELHIYAFFYLIATFGVSYFLYRFYEKPMMDWRDKN